MGGLDGGMIKSIIGIALVAVTIGALLTYWYVVVGIAAVGAGGYWLYKQNSDKGNQV